MPACCLSKATCEEFYARSRQPDEIRQLRAKRLTRMIPSRVPRLSISCEARVADSELSLNRNRKDSATRRWCPPLQNQQRWGSLCLAIAVQIKAGPASNQFQFGTISCYRLASLAGALAFHPLSRSARTTTGSVPGDPSNAWAS
jgi:hypothetical protein